MATLRETAKYIRSKNAGPFWVTLELFCDNEEAYEQVKNSPAICAETVAKLYHVKEDSVQIFYVPSINVVKISFPRAYPSGYRYERDMHYGQQYNVIADIEL